ncbi:hypothetical protein OG216_30645 [Streptomycetaceae bacterium NBC_01309]
MLRPSARGLPVDKSVFRDGASYSWSLRVEGSGTALSAWTSPCRFTADHASPSAPAIAFTDNYPNGTPPDVVRSVRFTVPAGSDTEQICYKVSADTTLPVGICETSSVPVGVDGTADITFPAPDGAWPFATVTAVSVDRAGNHSQSSSLRVPVQGTYEPPGDYNDDDRPDLLTVGSDHKLYLLPGIEGGGFGPRVVADEGDWTGAKIARAGDLVARNGDPWARPDSRNDLVVVRGAKLYVHPGNARGGFGPAVEIRSDFDWSGTESIVVSELSSSYYGIFAKKGDSLTQHVVSGLGLSVEVSHTVGTTGWRFKDVVPLHRDVDADWYLDVFVRDRLTGSLTLYRALPAPDSGSYFPATIEPVTTIAPFGWAAWQRPQLVAVGDLNGDEFGDLVATTTTGGLTAVPVSESGTPGAPQVLATRGYGIGTRLI